MGVPGFAWGSRFTGSFPPSPRGSVPKWIVNMFQRAWPKDTFKGIKKQLEKRGEVPTAFADVIAKLNF